tara:strand:- start:322 stop:600 length:279 start_codon:yes stop_codon:yes gene_type:complete
MARKKGGKSSGFVSNGERPNVRKDVRKMMRREYLSNSLEVVNNKLAAWAKGKRVMLTIPNQGADNAKHSFIRVPATDVWGKPGGRFVMKNNE